MRLAERLRARLAETAHLPPIAGRDDRVAPGTRATPASVLVGVVDRPEPTLLLTKRDERLRNHPGQVAFAGGRADPGDTSPAATALREAYEEIAMPPDAVELVGEDCAYQTGSGFLITPVVGVVPPDLPLHPCEIEVAKIFEVPLGWLMDPANRVAHRAEWEGRLHRFWEFPCKPHSIWGVTAALIVNLSRRIGHG
ncbi:CoA pyrophosphatase [Sphingomonas sp.]|uniref:CoA pyrophosphatase n=1 Tax=Sphingomonas sp. TaxID=28214 RepID=UPI003B00C302